MTYESQPPPGLPDVPETPELAALLAAAQRTAPDPQDEQRALAAFRAARDEGAYAAGSPWWRWRRRRDDWRPVPTRRGARTTRLMAGGLTVAVALGGVAVAAGSGVIPTPFGGEPGGPDSVRPAHSAPATPGRSVRPDGAEASAGSTPTPGSGRSTSGVGAERQDRALCEAYRAVEGRGKAADATAFERLEAAAGSAAAVPAYCDALLGQPAPGRTKAPRAGTGEEKDEERAKEKALEPDRSTPDRSTPDPVRGKGNGSTGRGNSSGD